MVHYDDFDQVWYLIDININIQMLLRRIIRFAASQTTPTRIPKAPKLLSGQLENFRLDAENARLFDGYTLDQLYGSKIGLKHSPAVQAEMRKDTIASLLLFVVGFTVIYHLHTLSVQNIAQLNQIQEKRLSREVKLPEGLKNDIKKTHLVGTEIHMV